MLLNGPLRQRWLGIVLGLCAGCLAAQTPKARPDFSLAANTALVNLTAGGSAQPVSISAAAFHGITEPIEVAVKGLPRGVTASPASFTLAPGEVQRVSLQAGPHAAGNSTVRFTGTLGSVVRTASVSVCTKIDVVTIHYDVGRTGLNDSETELTHASVNAAQFGLLRMLATDGVADAQPLLLSNLKMGRAGHDVVYVATEHDSVYAFDARTGAQLWRVSVLGAGESPSDSRACPFIAPEIGITSTPVIDRAAGPNGALFLVAATVDALGRYHQRLHALDVATGAELAHSPSEIGASYPGNGPNSSAGRVVFDPGQYAERAGLLLLNGAIYLGWASHCDHGPYNGWLMSYDESTLAQTGALALTPNGTGGGIWMAGSGLAADEQGFVYFLDGNGTFDTTLDQAGFPTGGDFGNGFIKISSAGGKLAVADYFEMSNTVNETANDLDLGSGGIMVIPDVVDLAGNVHHLAVGAGKDKMFYIVDRDSMGKFNPVSDAIYQEMPGAIKGVFSKPCFYNNKVYYAADVDKLRAFPITDGKLATSSSVESTTVFPFPGATPTISANGTLDGVVWAVERASPPVLHAYRADSLLELYNSAQAPSNRDQLGADNKFLTPMVANGKVYLSMPNGVAVYGLLP
jgi:hypothetical protein